MGLFKERRPSLPAMTMKTEEPESEGDKVLSIDRDFVTKHQTGVGVDISVGLEENSRHQCLLRLQPDAQDPTLYRVRLATNFPAFALKTSCTARSFSDWYYLDRVLSQHFPQCNIPSLPPRQQLWIKNQQTKLEEIALLILRCLNNKDVVSKKVFQLFLQTNLCKDLIQENLEGKRNDVVSRVPNLEMEKKLEEAKVIHFNLPKVNQNTYHGSSDSYKSVKNLFNDNRKRSLAYISENFNNLKPDRSLKSTLY